MAVHKVVERLQRDLSSSAQVIDELVRENYELREQVVYLLSHRDDDEPEASQSQRSSMGQE